MLDGPLAWVLDRERRSDDEHLFEAVLTVGLEDHASQPRIDREARELAPDVGQLVLRGERAELAQQVHAVADLAAVGRIEEREVLDVAEVQRRHLEDDAGQVRPQDLRVGEARPLGEGLLAVEPDADAVRRAPAAALALVGRGLRDRLDRQALHLQPGAVAADAGGAGIDNGANAGHGQGRLGHVRREHDPRAGVVLEDALLLCAGEARVERQQVDLRPEPAGERLGRVADLALAAEEDEHVVGAFAQQLLDGVGDLLGEVGVLVAFAVADLDRVGAARDVDDRRVIEVGGEARPGSIVALVMISLRSGRRGRRRLEVAEEEVDVQAAFVGLVDDDRVVAAQKWVAADLGEQKPVGEQPDERLGVRAVLEAHAGADGFADLYAELVGDALGHACARRSGAAGCGRSCRARRAPARGRAWAAGWSCRCRSRRRRPRPDGRGSWRAGPRVAR